MYQLILNIPLFRFIATILFFGVMVGCGSTKKYDSVLDSAEKMLDKQKDSALVLVQTIPNPSSLSDYNKARMALIMCQYYDKSYIPYSDSLINQAYNYFINTSHTKYKARSCYYKGYNTENNNNTDQAIEYYKNAIKYGTQADDNFILGITYGKIGRYHFEQSNVEQAISALTKSMEYYKKAGQKRNFAIISTLLGTHLIEKSMPQNAIEYFDQSEHTAVEINDTILISISKSLKGLAYLRIGNFLEARKEIDGSIAIMGDKVAPERYINLARLEFMVGNTDKALSNLSIPYNALKNNNNQERLQSVYKLLSEIETKSGNHAKAIEYLNLRMHIQDSIYNYKIKNSVSALMRKYNLEIEQEKVDKLTSQKKVLFSSFSIALLLIVAIVLYIINYRTRKHNRQLQDFKTSIEILRRNDISTTTIDNIRNKNVDLIRQFIDISIKYGHNPERFAEQISEITIFNFNKSNSWNDHRQFINDTGSGMASYIEKHYPQLTAEDIKLCYLTKLGFSTKEISILLKITDRAIFQRRRRIMLKLPNCGFSDIVEFISSIKNI